MVAPFRRSALQEQAALQRDECDKVDLLVQGDALLHIRRNSLKRAISNLIGNARRYADNLSVQANMRAGQVEIIVDDDGPGIPQDKRKDVLKPFFRLEASRNSDTGGQGLRPVHYHGHHQQPRGRTETRRQPHGWPESARDPCHCKSRDSTKHHGKTVSEQFAADPSDQ